MNIYKVEDKLPPDETPVLAKYMGKWRVLEIRWERPSWEETYRPFQYWEDPYDEGTELDWDGITEWCYLPGETPPGFDKAPVDSGVGLDDEAMTDNWLAHQMSNAFVVADAYYKTEETYKLAILRGFANRVLMKFGGDKSASALAIPFTMPIDSFISENEEDTGIKRI